MDGIGESYIVRIYRRSGKNRRLLVGTVEATDSAERKAFTNFNELREILTAGHGRAGSSPGARCGRGGKED